MYFNATSCGLYLILFIFALLTPACSGSRFGSGANKKGGSPSPAEGEPGSRDNGSGSGGAPSNRFAVSNPETGTPPTPEDVDPCSGSFQNSNVLIIDLKSGWLAGDGGRFFVDRLDPKCPGTPSLKIHYYHITKFVVESNRPLESFLGTNFATVGAAAPSTEALACEARIQLDEFSRYRLENNENPERVCSFNALDTFDQVWVLSGDEADKLDIATSSPLFESLVARLSARVSQKPLGLFLGAGLSNISHANAVAEALVGQPAFERNAEVEAGLFPSPKYPSLFRAAPLLPSQASELAPGSFKSNLNVLAGMPELYDYGEANFIGGVVKVLGPLRSEGLSIFDGAPPRCFADTVTLSGATVGARDRCGQAVISYLDRSNLRIYAEGNMARFYGLQRPQEYLARIARFLALRQ